MDLGKWYPIASSSDLPLRHVYQGQLWGRELAVWRADDGNVNVWENRCLHRGVRLSIGLNEGRELRCLYHGWRYANRTAGCTYIPAHPADAPARTICNNTYQCVEAHGLIWSAIDPATAFQTPEELRDIDPTVLRPIPINAPLDLVARFTADYDGTGKPLLFVQPIDAHKTVLRGLLTQNPTDRLTALRQHNDAMTKLRDRIEAEAATRPQPDPIRVQFQKVDAELAQMPARAKAGPKAELRVSVAKKFEIAQGVMAFHFTAMRGQLPTFQPGAHIDVHLPNGMIRQYSLTNAPGDTAHYAIAVKRDVASRGGSICLHDDVQIGDVLAISAPRNNFPLRRDATKTILIAGGIGITPLLAMAQTLAAQNLPFALHVFAQSTEQLGFDAILSRFAGQVTPHIGLSPQATAEAIADILQGHQPTQHVYICGPAPMLETAREIAHSAGWPGEAVHFEYFKNTRDIDDSSTFEIALARSALTLQVPAGKTILQVLQENGIEAPSSCEQGACGTCLTTVIEGEPDHQDVYLSHSEQAENQKILTCVSRAKSKRLVLDI